ncbi:hypothetical protein TNIN_330621 [Trichonephila inaurata madagascariensis]|uniref:Uncharacterized protein n=1 Tax=Trichonephila inaurata madagascariensis TaxID=2747483 RepID=A0A8X7CKV1_9ARAC|nr:hypothetical protein TNIN_330621 [Trichonephila inaurata madagascariensis]
MSVVRLKTLFWGNRDAKLASGHLTQPETGATLIYATSALLQRTLCDRAYTLSVSRKGIECVSECPTHILDRVRSLSVQGSMRGLKDGAVARKPVPKFPDVRGQVEDIILGNRDAKQPLVISHSPKQERL